MIINHPLLGPRDSEEFVYLGAADLINRPSNWEHDASAEDFYQYQYIREKMLLVIIVSSGTTSRAISLG